MYNLIMGAVDGVLAVERLLVRTDTSLETFVRPAGELDVSRLLSLPALCMPETGDTRSPQVAQVGNVISLTRAGRDYHFRFIRDEVIRPIPSERIEAVAAELGIGRFGFTRTHWAVKEADLYQVLIRKSIIDIPRPTAFALPSFAAESNRIAVMMPFGAEFAPVWSALKQAADSGGWVCQRADDIWEDSVLVNDVVALIARSKVVICDLTGRNANVFYEAGIAHTLGREVVLIAQSPDDVPFDLRHHRYLRYLGNAEGLIDLQGKLTGRLRTLMAR
ncbi:MAG: hypothetical protein ABIP57_12335 [Jatrophihabitantaceae bacterium]